MKSYPNCWLHRFACFLAFATFLLIIAGASVTSHRAGLAVPDWPTTYGQAMFRFPLGKMVGGIFYEHGHRLIASVVGLLTTALALWAFFGQRDTAIRRLGIAALAVVIAQGVLGGLTVKFFLPPPISIAHAALAEAFFCITIALALVTSPRWKEPQFETPHVRSLRWLALITTVVVYCQIILGATIRHAERALLAHILGAMIVFLAAGTAATTIFPSVKRKDFAVPAVGLLGLVFLQLWLGVWTLIVRVPKAASGQLDALQVIVPTIHLAVGALILGLSFALTLKCFGCLRSDVTPGAIPIKGYVEMAKPRIVSMVLVTTTLGFFLGSGLLHHGLGESGTWREWPLLLLTLLGVGSATGGAAVLNNYLERDVDAKMERTRHRALPAGLVSPEHALAYGVSLVLAGIIVLVRSVNLLTAFLVLLAAFLYVVVYTPLKRLTWLNTTFGSIPGAIPPLCGWAAATGRLDLGAWVLFLILFAWQHPHFYAIAWMFKEDYRNAGFKMLPVVDPSGASTFRQTILFATLLLGVSILPTVIGMTGKVYCAGAVVMGLALLTVGALLAHRKSFLDARRLLEASVIYLPLLLLLIIVDAGL
ncbi:MAG TPA: heme o synthase [Verrucomicrobiae bacterium]|nr:heme o synthase [Verrucomicrobiae bacterium]